MKNKQLRIAVMTVVVLTAIVLPTILFIRSQAAQTTQTGGPAHRVLIEKNQLDGSPIPEVISVPASPTPLDETTTTLPTRFDSAIRNFERRGIRDTAFSAEVQVEAVWPQREGGTTLRKTTYLIYRDGQGRTRRDLMPDQTSAGTENRPRISVISDPVASVAYLVDHRTSTARKVALAGEEVKSEAGAVQPNKRGTAPGFINIGTPNSQSVKTELPRERRAAEVEEQLGEREIGGMLAEGTRFVRTVSIGAPANEKPIEITTEEWYSPELQTVVAITISDPRFGRSEYRLTNIIRGEPSPTLFVIPPTYKLRP